MLNSIIRWILLALALILVGAVIPGIKVSGFLAALLAVMAIAIVNMLVKPIVMFLAFPINLLTLGLFTFVINALLFGLAAFIAPGFQVDGFFSALLGSILFSILSIMINLASGQVKTA